MPHYNMNQENLPNPNESLISDTNYIGKIVYGWKRANKYLYIGASTVGTSRPFSKSHEIINTIDYWIKGDCIDIWYTETPESLERFLIKTLNPPYNRSSKSINKVCTRCNKKFLTKEEFNCCYPCLAFYRSSQKPRLKKSILERDKKYIRYLYGEQ